MAVTRKHREEKEGKGEHGGKGSTIKEGGKHHQRNLQHVVHCLNKGCFFFLGLGGWVFFLEKPKKMGDGGRTRRGKEEAKVHRKEKINEVFRSVLRFIQSQIRVLVLKSQILRG